MVVCKLLRPRDWRHYGSHAHRDGIVQEWFLYGRAILCRLLGDRDCWVHDLGSNLCHGYLENLSERLLLPGCRKMGLCALRTGTNPRRACDCRCYADCDQE